MYVVSWLFVYCPRSAHKAFTEEIEDEGIENHTSMIMFRSSQCHLPQRRARCSHLNAIK